MKYSYEYLVLHKHERIIEILIECKISNDCMALFKLRHVTRGMKVVVTRRLGLTKETQNKRRKLIRCAFHTTVVHCEGSTNVQRQNKKPVTSASLATLYKSNFLTSIPVIVGSSSYLIKSFP